MKLIKLLILCACLIGVARFTHHQTHGFRLSKIVGNLCEEKQWIASDLPSEELLTQRYHYLGRGLQSFVFASEDGKYVIKLFNNRYQRNMNIYRLLSHLPLVGPRAQERYSYFHAKLLRTFSSYQIAEEELQNEAGLIFTHLNPSADLPERLTIVDPLHIEHTINPNEYGFIVQKRAKMVYPTLLSYIEEGNIDETKQAIASLVQLFIAKYEKGIADNDPLIRTNYGFIDGKPVQIDVGPFTKDPQIADPGNYSLEVLKATNSLKHWLEDHCPELCPFLAETLKEQLPAQTHQTTDNELLKT
ncbi:MAG: hypothetical protein JSR39_00075 [Verrucomicrobia bacterium]|nr:hypothetical protein [Verrucomicrobiota bacterium]